jgi:hypothetical protein
MTTRPPNFAAPRRASAGTRSLLRRAAGFTVMELTMGMVVTTLVMGAVAGLMSAAGQGWRQSGAAETSTSSATQVHLRLTRLFRSVRQIGYVKTGSMGVVPAGSEAAALVWKSDANLDNKIQYGELAVIKFCYSADPKDALTIRQYEIVPTSAQPDVNAEIPSTDYYKALYSSTFYNQFMARTDLGYSVVARDVAAAQFHKTDGGTVIRPAMEYVLKLQRGATTEMEYGTVAERVPTTLPVSQR